jgi:hypothetical protein
MPSAHSEALATDGELRYPSLCCYPSLLSVVSTSPTGPYESNVFRMEAATSSFKKKRAKENWSTAKVKGHEYYMLHIVGLGLYNEVRALELPPPSHRPTVPTHHRTTAPQHHCPITPTVRSHSSTTPLRRHLTSPRPNTPSFPSVTHTCRAAARCFGQICIREMISDIRGVPSAVLICLNTGFYV